jgi:hypothetical protein
MGSGALTTHPQTGQHFEKTASHSTGTPTNDSTNAAHAARFLWCFVISVGLWDAAGRRVRLQMAAL